MKKYILNWKPWPLTPWSNLVQRMAEFNQKFGKENIWIRIPGGTISQDPLKSRIPDNALDAFAQMGNPFIYSVNLNRTPYEESQELNRLLERLNIIAHSYGNEDYGMEGVQDLPVEQQNVSISDQGKNMAIAYLQKAQPFFEELHSDGIVPVLVGAMPSNQFGTNVNAYRNGWNMEVLNAANMIGGAMDFHAYNRTPGVDYDATLFKNILDTMGDIPAYIGEAGCLTYQQIAPKGHKEDTFYPASEQTLNEVDRVLRPIDVGGMHLAHHWSRTREIIDIGLWNYDATGYSPLGEAVDRLLNSSRPLYVVSCAPEDPTWLFNARVQKCRVVLSDGSYRLVLLKKSQYPAEGTLWTQEWEDRALV